MRVCFYVLLFSFRQLSQQLQLTAVIKLTLLMVTCHLQSSDHCAASGQFPV